MNDLHSLVQSLPEGRYKDYYNLHIEKGMHPSEEIFAEYALLALSPSDRSQAEKEEAARYLLSVSLENLPEGRSSEVFLEQLKGRFPDGPLQASLGIEEMVFLSNIASCLRASWDMPRSQNAEKVIADREAELFLWGSVAGEKPASPVVIEGDLFWLYYMGRDLRGVCMHSLPGKGRGLPVVFVCPENCSGDMVDEDAILRIACHEMIHSSQKPYVEEEVQGWNIKARWALLEAITEGLAICRIGKQNPFSAAEISKRDYAYLVTALFHEMREAGIADRDFYEKLEEMNANTLSRSVDLLSSPEGFLKRIETAVHSLVLQHMISSRRASDTEESPGEKDALDFTGDLLFSGANSLGIINEILSARDNSNLAK